MIKNLLKICVVVVVGILSFVVGQMVWSRIAPKQVLPAPIVIRNTKPEAERFLPDAAVSGIIENGKLVRDNEKWPLSGKDIYIGKVYIRDDLTGFEQINSARIKDGQRIFVDFYKNKKLDVVVGKIKTIENRYITFASDPTNEKYFLNPKFKFMVADPARIFWVWGDKPDKLKTDDILEISKNTFTYIAPISGSATGSIKITRRAEGWINIELGEERIPIIINRGSRISDGKTFKPRQLSDLVEGTKVYIMYWYGKGALIASGVSINP